MVTVTKWIFTFKIINLEYNQGEKSFGYMVTMTEIYHITGPPGTGKTTYLERQAREGLNKRGSGQVAILSLTRAAAREIAGRGLEIPDEQIGTLHAFCFRGAGRPEIADKKIAEWNDYAPKFKLSLPTYDDADVDDMDISKIGGGDDEQADQCFNAMNLFRHNQTPPNQWPIFVKEFAGKWNAWKSDAELMDFTDLIEFGLTDIVAAPGHPEILIIDECQDMSRLEIALIHKWSEAAEVVLMAGDPDQAIYTWRGANPKVFIENVIPESHKKYLRQSFRLPEVVHSFARTWIAQIKDREDVDFRARDTRGSLEYAEADYNSPAEIVEICADNYLQGKTTMVLTTCGYMLFPVIALLKEAGLPFHNKFSTKNAKWNPLRRIKKRVMPVDRIASFLRPDESSEEYQREWFKADFKNWIGVLNSKGLLTRGVKTEIADDEFQIPKSFDEFSDWFISDKDALRANNLDLDWFLRNVIASRKAPLVYPVQVVRKFGARVLHDEPLITVGTIHSVKGGEADTVIICPDLSYSGWKFYEASDQGRADVTRVFYVGFTRARERLILCNQASTRAVSW